MSNHLTKIEPIYSLQIDFGGKFQNSNETFWGDFQTKWFYKTDGKMFSEKTLEDDFQDKTF